MLFWEILFWTSFFLIFYNYGGYALFILIFTRLRRKKDPFHDPGYLPTLSFIVAAYNEEDFIESKIQNSLQQEYPADKIEFIFITDGSNDQTNEIIRNYPRIRLLFHPERKGKSAALNRAVLHASGEILIFSDANTTLNNKATYKIARHYLDPKIGGVAGEKKVSDPGGDQVGAGEGLYWKYESALKKIDSDFYSVVGAAGELFSLRKDLYEPISNHIILDDFIISLKVAQKGFRVIYEPEAYAIEAPSFSIGDEKKRKIRIAAGGFQAIGELKTLLQFWKQPKVSFLYISHRLLRWTISPICFVLAFFSNLWLAIYSEQIIYQYVFFSQVLFYSLAALGAIRWPLKNHKLFKLPYYFVFMNYSIVLGFFRFLKGKQSATWEKARRKQPLPS